MTVRDLGYRAYEGERLPPSNNTMVLLRYGLRRAWASWLVKIALFLGWIPALVGAVIVGVSFATGATSWVEPASFVRTLLNWQLWLCVTMITLGAGAGAIAEDLTFKAFQFYFAKPVTPPQYLAGRVVAVGVWSFTLTFGPALLDILALVGTASADQRLTRVGLLLPALVASLLISTVAAVASVGISSLSKSRALTMTAWILLFIVPHAVGSVVDKISHWPWLLLASLPKLLGVVDDALFKVGGEGKLQWYYALPILAGVVVGGVALSLYRLRRAEVIT